MSDAGKPSVSTSWADPEILARAKRATALEALFQAFSGGTPERMLAYVKAAEGLDEQHLSLAAIRLIERWQKTTVPPFAVLRETTLQIGAERIAGGKNPKKTPEQTRELVKRRLALLREDHGGLTIGAASRIDPQDEAQIRAHWEQFGPGFDWPPTTA